MLQRYYHKKAGHLQMASQNYSDFPTSFQPVGQSLNNNKSIAIELKKIFI